MQAHDQCCTEINATLDDEENLLDVFDLVDSLKASISKGQYTDQQIADSCFAGNVDALLDARKNVIRLQTDSYKPWNAPEQ